MEIVRLDSNKSKNEGKLFCVLPYLEGQKYTFGQNCNWIKNKADQGEFIFFPSTWEITEWPMCQIHCSNNTYIIRDLHISQIAVRKMKILLNDKIIKEPTRLQTGDILQLTNNSVQDPSEVWKLWSLFQQTQDVDHLPHRRNVTFLFRERTNESAEATSGHRSSNIDGHPALENRVVLSKIFSFLEHNHDLKTIRLVCQSWNEEGSILLKSRTQLKFNLVVYRNPKDSMRFFLYANEMLAFRHPNWKIKFDIHKIRYKNEFYDGGPAIKFAQDVQKYFQIQDPPICANLRSLNLLHCFDYLEEGDDFLSMIFAKVAPTLQELIIATYRLDNNVVHHARIRNEIALGDEEVIDPHYIPVELKNLKKFQMDLNCEMNPKSRKFVQYVLNQVRNVSEVNLTSFKENMNSLILEEMVQVGFPKLKSITVRRINRDGFKLLRGLSKKILRQIIITYSSVECKDDYDLVRLLERRDSFKIVDVKVPETWDARMRSKVVMML